MDVNALAIIASKSALFRLQVLEYHGSALLELVRNRILHFSGTPILESTVKRKCIFSALKLRPVRAL